MTTIYDYAERNETFVRNVSRHRLRVNLTTGKVYDLLLDAWTSPGVGDGEFCEFSQRLTGLAWMHTTDNIEDNPQFLDDHAFQAREYDVTVTLHRGGLLTMSNTRFDTPYNRGRYVAPGHCMFTYTDELSTTLFPVLYDDEGTPLVRTRMSKTPLLVDLNAMQAIAVNDDRWASSRKVFRKFAFDAPWSWFKPEALRRYADPMIDYSFVETRERNKVRAATRELVQYLQMTAQVEDDATPNGEVNSKDVFTNTVRGMVSEKLTLLDSMDRYGMTLSNGLYAVCQLLGLGRVHGSTLVQQLQKINIAKLQYEPFDDIAVDVAGVRKKFDRIYLTNPTLTLAQWREVLPSIRNS